MSLIEKLGTVAQEKMANERFNERNWSEGGCYSTFEK